MDGHQFLTLSLTEKMTQADDGGEFIAKCEAQYEALSQQVNNLPTELMGATNGQYGPRAVKFDRPATYSMLRPAVHTGFGSFVRKERTYSSAKSYNISTQKWSHVGTSFKWTNEVQPQLERTNSERPEFRQRNDKVLESVIASLATLEQFLDEQGIDMTDTFRTKFLEMDLCTTAGCPQCKPVDHAINQARKAQRRPARGLMDDPYFRLEEERLRQSLNKR